MIFAIYVQWGEDSRQRHEHPPRTNEVKKRAGKAGTCAIPPACYSPSAWPGWGHAPIRPPRIPLYDDFPLSLCFQPIIWGDQFMPPGTSRPPRFTDHCHFRSHVDRDAFLSSTFIYHVPDNRESHTCTYLGSPPVPGPLRPCINLSRSQPRRAGS